MSQICSPHLIVYILSIGWLTAHGWSFISHHWQGEVPRITQWWGWQWVEVRWSEVKWQGIRYFRVRVPISTTKSEKVHKDADLHLPTTRLNTRQGQQDVLNKKWKVVTDMSISVFHPSGVDSKANTCCSYQGAFPSDWSDWYCFPAAVATLSWTAVALVRWSQSKQSSQLCLSRDDMTLVWRSLF